MGYFYILCSLVAGTAKGYCGKKTSGLVKKNSDAMIFNGIRMSFCIVIGFLILSVQGNLSALKLDSISLAITALSGFTTSMFVVSWLISVKTGAYMMLDVFLVMGTVIPLIGGYFFFQEAVHWYQIVGFIILLVAVYFMCSYNSSIKGKMTGKAFVLLLLCAAANGLTDFSQKIYVKTVAAPDASVFNFYTYLFSAIVLAVFYLIFRVKEGNAAEDHPDFRKAIIYILIMSLSLFLYSFFKTKAAVLLSSAELYPLSQGSGLIVSTFMASLLFHEKLNKKCVFGILLAFVSMLFSNCYESIAALFLH